MWNKRSHPGPRPSSMVHSLAMKSLKQAGSQLDMRDSRLLFLCLSPGKDDHVQGALPPFPPKNINNSDVYMMGLYFTIYPECHTHTETHRDRQTHIHKCTRMCVHTHTHHIHTHRHTPHIHTPHIHTHTPHHTTHTHHTHTHTHQGTLLSFLGRRM